MHRLEGLKNKCAKALVITAHPDDESLFTGGAIAELKKWHWTVLCVTDCDERYNARRRKELLQACSVYNKGGSKVKPIMLAIAKERGGLLRGNARKKILEFIKEIGPFDIFFTHSKEGDYGHKTHRSIHRIVKGLRLRNLYSFTAKHSKNTSAVNLSSESLRAKRRALKIYLNGSQKSNLSRLKRLVTYAIRSKVELFNPVN